MGFFDRIVHAFNAFIGLDPPGDSYYRPATYLNYGTSYSYRPDKVTLKRGNEKSIVAAIYNRIAIDCSSTVIRHALVDENNCYLENVDDGLDNCLSLETNKDQTSKAFIRDVVMSLFDEGTVAIVPIDTTYNPNDTEAYDIESMRVGKIIQWFPDHVRVEAYNDRIGAKRELMLKKSEVAIIENPLYAIMNEPNSVLQRLIRKENLLDVIDEQSGSGKLDLIIQLPYVIKTDARRKQAEERRNDIESQLKESKYGIAYTDGTEHVTQLNRPVENNLMKQVEFYTSMLYSQLGITDTILNGTADEKTMLNYLNRSVRPILDSIVDEVKRKFLTKKARSQGHTIMYFNDPFRLVPLANMADIADAFTRNAILSPNEIRQIVGFKPSKDPMADKLTNRNLNQPEDLTKKKNKDAEPSDVNPDDNEGSSGKGAETK